MNGRRALDVSGLPEIAFGHCDPLWWGVLCVIAIEGTMVVLLAATYVYVRGNFLEWPPVGFGARVQALAAAEALVLALSAIPTNRMNAAAAAGDLRRIQRWAVVTTVAGLAFVALRAFELAALPFRWDLNAYASTVWGLLFLNTIHAVSGAIEDATTTALAFVGPFEQKHRMDVIAGGWLWYFVIGSWLPMYVLLYLAPRLLRS